MARSVVEQDLWLFILAAEAEHLRVARRLDRGQGLFVHILTLLVRSFQCYLLKYILRFMVV